MQSIFFGRSFLASLSTAQVGAYNVTFEPSCRNNRHIHHAKNGGGQILICVTGESWYREEEKAAVSMKPGDACANEWCEPVTDEEYAALS